MRRFFTILEGEGKGTHKPLTSNLTIVGRSRNADLQIEDSLVSRRHLEIRIEGEVVFVENKSTHGSFLNGKPLVGVVSLNPGDLVDIGHTKLCYEESVEGPLPTSGSESMESMSAEIDGTRVADSDAEPINPKDKDAHPEATRAMGEDGTRMLGASELPNWASQEKLEKAASSKGGWVWFFLAVVLVAAGGGYWYFFVRDSDNAREAGPMEYRDSLYGFNLEYPQGWSKVSESSGEIVYGTGAEGDPAWARLNMHTDRDVENALTGLTDGFNQYQETLKKRYAGFELNGSKQLDFNNARVVFFGFSSTKLDGKGIYVLNAETRIGVECVSPDSCYDQYAAAFNSILQSFSLRDVSSQQFIDFPMPDDGMQQLALANRAEVSRQVDEYARVGQMLLAARDVKPDNLYESVQDFRKALQLAIAPPVRLASFRTLAQGLLEATKQFNRALAHQRYEITRALNDGDNARAYWEANKLMQMVTDKTDPAYQEGFKVVQSIQRPRGQ